MNRSINFGKFGEDQARVFLKRQGYQILEVNFRNVIGEIDIIAKDQGTLCFIEVKARRNDDLGSPFDAVTKLKQKQIIKVAQSYMQDRDMDDINARFDVVGIWYDETGKARVELIRDAFEVDS